MSIELKHEHIANLEIPLGFTIFCDMDGTLVDTDYANFLSYKRALIDVGTNCGIFDIEFTNERLNRESLKELAPSLTTTQLETIVALKEEYFMEFISETRLNTELANLVKGCCQNNRLILVTGCRGKRALEILKHHNVLNDFARLICWEDTNQSDSSNKYESAIKLTGAIPDYIFIFEDDDICIEDAVRAGVPIKNIQKIFIEPRDCDESI
ncbi:HAD family hydrolase [Shewanella oncorhynchi]|uniref:HAD family hydrolase n=1 Tax=Shewanella oncorhynchi TaxID=2726434 RepID=UPI000DEB4CD4|nr:beta-phosphoglucomutase-like phosphatase (HAD superfamily) [Shewanella putrefaciens]